MLRIRICAVAIMAVLILPAVTGCLLSSAAQAQAMECCAQLTCTQGHQQNVCFSNAASSAGSQSAPELVVSIVGPSMAAALLPVSTRQLATSTLADAGDVRQHAPPDLYTLHLALLI
jgi:hypothetical protein